MTGKRGVILAIIAIVLIVGVIGFLMSRPHSTETPPTQEPQTMTTTNYDLTTDQEGLSKAVATMTLENGETIQFRFFTNEAPNTVKRIATLIAQGFYNGIMFHRVVPGFVVQAGDPTGTGGGGSGVKLKAEFNSHKHVKGILSMARTNDPNSADSQFFIMLGEHPHLDNQYTVFGKVVKGLENVDHIKRGDKIKSFTIE
jgi:cyclophilin family peptidyl-prolyl cis-trans isomerase